MTWAAGAEAAPRITIAPITGDKRATVQSQIGAALCKQNTCVSSTRVFTKKKPDWKKIQSSNVQGLLVGGVGKAKSGGGKELTLSWLNKPGKAAQSWTFPLTKQGKLTTSSLQQLSGDVNNLATGAAAPLTAPAGDTSVASGVAAGTAPARAPRRPRGWRAGAAAGARGSPPPRGPAPPPPAGPAPAPGDSPPAAPHRGEDPGRHAGGARCGGRCRRRGPAAPVAVRAGGRLRSPQPQPLLRPVTDAAALQPGAVLRSAPPAPALPPRLPHRPRP